MSKWVAGGRERRELQAAQRRVSVDVKQPSESEAELTGMTTYRYYHDAI